MIALSVAFNLFWTQTKRRANLLMLLTLFSLAFYLCLISLTGSSVQQYLQMNLRNLLGADAVLVAHNQIAQNAVQHLHANSREVAQTQQFTLTLTHKGHWKPVSIKAVDTHYPLKGTLSVSSTLSLQGDTRDSGPSVGEVWLDSRTISALAVSIGDTIDVAGQPLKVAGVLLEEPDRLLEDHSVAHRGMIALDTLTTLPKPDSITYRYLLDASQAQQKDLVAWAKQQPQWHLLSQSEGNHPLSELWSRIQKFTGLTSVLLFILGAITLDLIGQRLATQQQHYLAICLANGLNRWQSRAVSIYLLLFTSFSALIPAVVLAVFAEQSAITLLNQYLPNIQSDWQWPALVKIGLLCFGLFFISQLPSFVAMQRTEIRDLLRDVPMTHRSQLGRVLFPIVSMVLIIGFYSDNWHLTFVFLVTITVCLLFMLIMTWSTFFIGERLTRGRVGILAIALYMMRKRITVKAAQIVGIGLSLTLLLISTRTTEDLTRMIETAMQSNDGNLLVSRANKEHVNALTEWAKENGAQIKGMSPFRISLLTHINGSPVNDGSLGASDTRSALKDGIRLTWAKDVPANNEILEGSWQQLNTAHYDASSRSKSTSLVDSFVYPISVEEEVFEDLNLALGDKLTFLIDKHRLLAQVSSVHGFKSGGSSITFWFVLGHGKPPVISENPLFMGSLQIADAKWGQLSEVWQKYPGLSLVSFQQIKQRIESFGNAAIGVILAFNVFIALMSALLVTAAIKGYESDDRKRNGLMLSFGLPRKDCLKLVSYEWLLTAIIPAAGGILSTVVGASFIYQQQFGLPYEPSWMWLFFSAISTVLGIAGAGIWMCREHLNVSVPSLLNDGERPSC